MSNDFISRQDVAEFMFENRYSTSINNAFDQLKVITTAYDLDKAIKVLNTEAERFEDSGRAYEDEKELGIAEGFRKAVKIVEDGGEHYHTTADGGM